MPDFTIWNRCNNNCLMCSNPINIRDKNGSFHLSVDDLISRIEIWRRRNKLNKENINLTGGEPTIRPDFLQLIRRIRKTFTENRIVIISNGRMFNYPWFAKECLKTNNLVLEVAIHGFNAYLHDSITRVRGSFDQTISGIYNILKYKKSSQELEIRIIITKLNYKQIDETVNFIKRKFPIVDRIVLIFMEMEGYAEKNFKIVGLTYKEIESHLSLSRLKKWRRGSIEIRFYHFPLCVLKPELWEHIWRTLRKDEVTFLPRCNQCLYKKYCLGIHKDYLRLVGDKEFRPIKRKLDLLVQNNFYHPIIGIRKLSEERL